MAERDVAELVFACREAGRSQIGIVLDALHFFYGRRDPGLVRRQQTVARAFRQKTGQQMDDKPVGAS